MVVDGVGSYCSDVTEEYPLTDKADPLARESESYYRFDGSKIETLKKVWLEPARGFLSDEFFNMPGLGALVQPGLDLHFRRLEQVRRGDGPGSLRPPRADQAAA